MEQVRCPECNAFKDPETRCGNCRSNDRYRRQGIAINQRCKACLAFTKIKAGGTCARCLKEEGMRECSVCHELSIALLEFKKKQSVCRKCRHPLRHLTPKQRALHAAYKRKYGVSYDEYARRSQEQGGRCLICKKTRKLVVDHDHATGAVRGLLCANCNAGIGMMQDSPDVLRSAADYLEATVPSPLPEPPAWPAQAGEPVAPGPELALPTEGSERS